MLRTDHWLSEARNVLQLHLDQPVWETGGAQMAVRDLTSQEKMSAWTADELADFLIYEDLQGPAEALRSAGVNGADFLSWRLGDGAFHR